MKLNQFSVVAVGIYIAHHYYPQAAKGRKYVATSKCVSSAKLFHCKSKIALPLFSRSTLVNKEPDSMLAHMFKDKG